MLADKRDYAHKHRTRQRKIGTVTRCIPQNAVETCDVSSCTMSPVINRPLPMSHYEPQQGEGRLPLPQGLNQHQVKLSPAL